MKTKYYLIFLILIPLMFVNCKKNSTSKVQANGLTVDINKLIPDTTLTKIKNLGMPINTGETPPNIENIYNASPFILKNSSVVGDYQGKVFADFKVKFYQQNNDKLTISMDYVNGPESGTGVGGFIVGNGNYFTAVMDVTVTNQSANARATMIISGLLTTTGITNFYYANFMIDNKGNTTIFIKNSTGRVIYDSDGTSEFITSLKSMPANNLPWGQGVSSVWTDNK